MPTQPENPIPLRAEPLLWLGLVLNTGIYTTIFLNNNPAPTILLLATLAFSTPIQIAAAISTRKWRKNDGTNPNLTRAAGIYIIPIIPLIAATLYQIASK